MGIFDAVADVFTTYHCQLQFRDKVMGGIPKDPKIIEGWIRAKAGVNETEEVRRMMLRTLVELGADVTPDMDYDQLVQASEAMAGSRETVGFKTDENGLYLESRIVKAAVKECVNILYAGQRWLPTKKGPRSVAAERVFVNPDNISLGVKEPTNVALFIGHVSGPKGTTGTLSYHEYVEKAIVEFDLMVAEDAIPHEAWPRLWVLMQENGLGALRSQGFGRFDLLAFDKVKEGAKIKESKAA